MGQFKIKPRQSGRSLRAKLRMVELENLALRRQLDKLRVDREIIRPATLQDLADLSGRPNDPSH